MTNITMPDANTLAAEKRADWMFWGAAVILLFCALGMRALWGAEGRWAEIVREMLLSGDFFHPTITGRTYFDKPLGSYWLILIFTPFLGLTEWTVRLPSALCALLTLWATRKLGALLYTPATGKLAGWLLLTAQGFLFWARTGTAETANLACIMLAVYWYWRQRYSVSFANYFVFYLILAIGGQMKGLTAWVIPCLAIAPDIVREQRWRQHINARHWLAVFIGIFIYLTPFLLAAANNANNPAGGLMLVFRENIQRFFQPFDHIEPFYVYLLYLPLLFLPWSPFLLAGLWQLRRGNISPKTRRLVETMAIIFLFFTLSGSRRSYYILPMVPFCAIFTAQWLQNLSAGPTHCFALLKKIPAAKFLARPLHLSEPLSGLLLLIVCALGIFFCAAQPLLDKYRTERPFAEAVKATGTRTAQEIAFFGQYKENIVFYLGLNPPNHPIITDAAAAHEFLASDPRRILIIKRAQFDQILAQTPAAEQSHWRIICSEAVPFWKKRQARSKKTTLAVAIKRPLSSPSL